MLRCARNDDVLVRNDDVLARNDDAFARNDDGWGPFECLKDHGFNKYSAANQEWTGVQLLF